jgi:hypothetical protein
MCSLALSAVLYCVLLKASHPELAAAAAAEHSRAPKQLHSAAEVVAAARKRVSATWQQGVAHMGPGLQVRRGSSLAAFVPPVQVPAGATKRWGATCACLSHNSLQREYEPLWPTNTLALPPAGTAAVDVCRRWAS